MQRTWMLSACLALVACQGGGEATTDSTAEAVQPPPEPVDTRPTWQREESKWLRDIRQLTALGVRSGESYFDARGERVLFMSVPKDYPFFQIYLLDLRDPKAKPVRVSTGRGKTTCPWFHPDGDRFIYASTHRDPDLSAKEAAARAKAQAPPAERTRYEWDFDAQYDIYEARLDGAIVRQLTDTPGYDAECAYSADGARVVFASARTGDLEIHTMAADGTDVQQVTHSPGYDGGPFFSPDGKHVIWRGDHTGDQKLQLWLAWADGRGKRRLTHNAAVNWGPYFHPDGQRCIYATSRHGHQNYELYLHEFASGREARITWWEGFDGLPAFAADGGRLLWTSKRGGARSQVFVADFVDAWAAAESP